MGNKRNWEFDFIINSDENCIIKFNVSTFDRKIFIFFLFEENGNYSLKHVCYNRYEIFELMLRATDPKNGGESYSAATYYKSPIYQKEIKDRYLTVIKEMDQEFLKETVETLRKTDFVNHKTTEECYGLDGFDVTAEVFGYDFWSWCCYADPYYKDIFSLLNYLLDLIDLDSHYRFRLVEDE